MATFSLVSQALRTGEPLPQAFHQNLLDRLHYHGNVGRQTFKADKAGKDDVHKSQMEHVAKYEYLFYATSICAVFQVLEVSVPSPRYDPVADRVTLGPERTAYNHDTPCWRGPFAGLCTMAGGI